MHMGIEGNELADGLARQGIQKRVKDKDHFITLSFLKQTMKAKLLQAWKQSWISETLREEEGRQARGLGKFYRQQARRQVPRFSWKPPNMNSFSRSTQSAYFQVRTGVGNILSHLEKIRKSATSLCNFCKKNKQTVTHLLLHCKEFSKERNQAFEKVEPRTLPILFNTEVGREATMRYLQSTKCMMTAKTEIEKTH